MTLTRKSKKTTPERAAQKTAKRLRNTMLKREKRAYARIHNSAKTLHRMKHNGNNKRSSNAAKTLHRMKNTNNNNFKFR